MDKLWARNNVSLGISVMDTRIGEGGSDHFQSY